MKKLLVLVACLIAGSFVLASEVGNNPEGEGFKFSFDFGFDHSSREVELDEKALIYYDDSDYGDGYGYIYKYWLVSFDGEETLDKLFLNLNFGFGRYAFYIKGGMARMKSELFDLLLYYQYEYYFAGSLEDWYQYDESGYWLSKKGKGDWSPFYGAGFKATFFESGDFRVGMDAQYNIYDLDSDVVLYQDSYTDMGGLYDELFQIALDKTKTTEYHVALVLSKKMEHVSPYGGFKLSGYSTDYEGHYLEYDYYDGVLDYWYYFPWEFTTKPQDIYGFFFGVDCTLTANVHLNSELRVGDETAMTTFFSFKF
ncbi:MAG: hypothetical protein AB1756_03940 [Acidobacteriota bacterium]